MRDYSPEACAERQARWERQDAEYERQQCKRNMEYNVMFAMLALIGAALLAVLFVG